MIRICHHSLHGISNIVSEVLLALIAFTVIIGLIQLVNFPLNIIEGKEGDYTLILVDYVPVNSTTLLIIFNEDIHIRLTYPNATMLVFREGKWINTLNVRAGDLVLLKVKDNVNFRKLLLITDSDIIVLSNPYIKGNN